MVSYESDTFNPLLIAETDLGSSMYYLQDPQKVERPDVVNNQLEVFFEYMPGIRHGLYRRYDFNSQMIYACNYVYGRRHGQSIEYYPNGKIKIKCKFNNGKLEGMMYIYNMDGTGSHILQFKNGICIN